MSSLLEKLMLYVSENNGYFSEIIKGNSIQVSQIRSNKEWVKLPITSKIDYGITGIGLDNCFYQDMGTDKLINKRTSGSTGLYMDVFWNRKDYLKSLIPIWNLRKKTCAVLPGDKHCFFFTGRYAFDMDIDEEKRENSLGFNKSNLTENRLLQIYNEILDYSPVWFNLQPSIAFLLSRIKVKYKLPDITSLKYIELSGEMLFPSTLQLIKKAFPVCIANQYGCNEVNSIAYGIDNEAMKIISESVYVEILDEEGAELNEGQKGDICITSLHNRLMPFIRYRTGDIGMKYSQVVNGKREEFLELTAGRNNDWIMSKDRELINAYVLLRPIECVNSMIEDAILQFQIVQKSLQEFEIRLVIDDEIEKSEIERIFLENVIDIRLVNMIFGFRYYEIGLLNERGKLAWFISKIK